jgi:hypothetical protein
MLALLFYWNWMNDNFDLQWIIINFNWPTKQAIKKRDLNQALYDYNGDNEQQKTITPTKKLKTRNLIYL